MESHDDIIIRYDSPVASITLNRQEKLNALNQSLVDRLLETFRNLENDSQISIITLEGSGLSFCAGGDIDVMRKANEQHNLSEVELVTRTFQDLIAHMRKSRLLFISFVHGSAMGGGAGLALACDLVYAKEGARFGWPYVALGFGPDGGASYELSNALGRYKALETLLFSRQYSAAEMAANRFINEVVAADEWEDRKATKLHTLRTYPVPLLSSLKRLLEAAESTKPEPSLALEYQTMMATAYHPYHRERVKAFFDKKSERQRKTMVDSSVAYISVLVRSREDAETFASTLMLPLQEPERLDDWKCSCLTIPLDRANLYFLVPDEGSPLGNRLAGGNRYFTLAIRCGSQLVELTDDLIIVKESPLISFYERNGPPPSFQHDVIKKLDHVLYVTHSLVESKQAMLTQTGLLPKDSHSFWYFPDFDVTDMTYALDCAFLEFNQPHGNEGIFSQVLQESGEGLFALAFEVVEMDEAVERFRQNGTKIGDPLPIRAVSPETKQTEIIEKSATFSLKSTAGLRVLITNLSWI